MSGYPTIESSDPQFECEHVKIITVKSRALRRRGDISLFVPPEAERRSHVPLVLLLHGVYDSHWAWTMKGGAHRIALRLLRERKIRPMILAMPSDGLWGDGSGYLVHGAEDCERWIMDDVFNAVSEIAPAVDDSSPLFMAGLSMGGYGALRLGSKYAERVAGISAHSAITRPEQMRLFVEEPLSAYVGELDGDADPMFWIKKNRATLPPLRFDCGTSDSLIEANRELHRNLLAEGIPHTYEEFSGDHNWIYWQQHVQETLLFVDAILESRLKRTRTSGPLSRQPSEQEEGSAEEKLGDSV
jgi:putative tributyrin esterase